jgi:hypothetical protein
VSYSFTFIPFEIAIGYAPIVVFFFPIDKKKNGIGNKLISDILVFAIEIEYSSVHRMPSVKLSGQTLGTTTNTMPTSTSLQDISSHHTQKFTWNDNNNNDKDQRLVSVSE